MRESGKSIEARAKATKKIQGKPYHDHGDIVAGRKRIMKATGREPNGWVPVCDDIACNVCRKLIDEQSPRTQEADDKRNARKAKCAQ